MIARLFVWLVNSYFGRWVLPYFAKDAHYGMATSFIFFCLTAILIIAVCCLFFLWLLISLAGHFGPVTVLLVLAFLGLFVYSRLRYRRE